VEFGFKITAKYYHTHRVVNIIIFFFLYYYYYYGLAGIQARCGHVSSADRLDLLDALERRLVQQFVEIGCVL